MKRSISKHLAYADDFDIIQRAKSDLEQQKKSMDLQVNEEKPKYMLSKINKNNALKTPRNTKMRLYHMSYSMGVRGVGTKIQRKTRNY